MLRELTYTASSRDALGNTSLLTAVYGYNTSLFSAVYGYKKNREDSDANEESSDASSGDPVEPGKGEHWTSVTSRWWRGSGKFPSLT